MTTKSEILNFLSSQKERLFLLGVTKLGLFGSYAKDRADVFSDIDIVIETDAKKMVKSLGNPFLVVTFLDDFRKSVSDKFGVLVDICDTTSMPAQTKEELVKGAIYV
ncbi:nucleotidyltransferase domain-containing protein [Campylobacter concisus]|uniref:nucleotidyltransferase family protein n=1 Tax=Campylobacter concisus TaxID=199 RepID=UPI000CD8779D|nr:nucleotidyltransferase domain-containing protein [Campylobacter concisus]MBE8585624.1 nucleotidyltransferase domain-containing protein [Campylobacter concisus]